jgi:quercetin dioxygenase-like cupin family protein
MEQMKPAVVPAGGGQKLWVIGNEIEIKLASAETAGALFIFENETPPGVGVPPHVHTREDEILHVMEGEYEVFLDGKIYTAAKGTVASFPRNVVHGFRNISGRAARALFIVTPGQSFENFFRELNQVAPTIPADLEAVAAVMEKYGLPIVQSQPANETAAAA